MAENLDYTVQYNIDGTMYSAQPADGALNVTAGTAENPVALVTMSEADWQAMQSGSVVGPAAMFAPEKMDESRLEKMRNTKGKLNLELTKDDGDVANSTIVFNGVETPEVTLMMKAEDFDKVLRGELNSQMAFMTGKLKFKGDMAFLMKLGSLM